MSSLDDSPTEDVPHEVAERTDFRQAPGWLWELIPNRASPITANHVTVFATIRSFVRPNQPMPFPGVDLIAAKAGFSRRTVFRLMRELEAVGALRRVSRGKEGGGRTSSAYELAGNDGPLRPEANVPSATRLVNAQVEAKVPPVTPLVDVRTGAQFETEFADETDQECQIARPRVPNSVTKCATGDTRSRCIEVEVEVDESQSLSPSTSSNGVTRPPSGGEAKAQSRGSGDGLDLFTVLFRPTPSPTRRNVAYRPALGTGAVVSMSTPVATPPPPHHPPLSQRARPAPTPQPSLGDVCPWLRTRPPASVDPAPAPPEPAPPPPTRDTPPRRPSLSLVPTEPDRPDWPQLLCVASEQQEAREKRWAGRKSRRHADDDCVDLHEFLDASER
jgi:hypothetical protein